jgi:hypothetical protein
MKNANKFFSTLLLTLSLTGASALNTKSLLAQNPTIGGSQHSINLQPRTPNTNYLASNDRLVEETTYTVPANTVGVFTLKNDTSGSDVDIYVYDVNSGQRLNKGENNGTQTELVTTPVFDRSTDVTVRIVNRGEPAQYQLKTHSVNLGHKFGIAFVETMLTCSLERGNSRDRTASRTVTTISSMLQGSNLGGVAQDVMINELTSSLKEQFGYGCLGDLVVNFSVSTLKEVYKNYY